MPKREVVLIVSRGFALFLITWALIELTYLPERLFSLYHHFGTQSVLTGTRDYWESYYSLATVLLIGRLIGLLIGAWIFWKCGPKVQALFSAKPTSEHD